MVRALVTWKKTTDLRMLHSVAETDAVNSVVVNGLEHGWHMSNLLSPKLVLYVPLAQGVQVRFSVDSASYPASQKTKTEANRHKTF